MTKKEKFQTIINILTTVSADAELITAMEHEIELLDKKGSKGNAKKQEANLELGNRIVDLLTESEGALTATEILENVDFSNIEGIEKLSLPKINAVLSNLGKVQKKINKSKDKKRTVFTIGTGEGFTPTKETE